MIEFRQKEFTEYDAMRYLYVELMRDDRWRKKVRKIDSSSLIPTLRGNNIVIERFVITNRPFKKDRFRMYLKVGARAKMPDAVRLPGTTTDSNKLWGGSIAIKPGGIFRQKNNSEIALFQKEFRKKNKGGGGGGGQQNNGDGKVLETKMDEFRAEIRYETTKPKGDTIEYNKKDRSIVLEYDTIRDAIESLNILPFGLDYNIYLLDV